MAVDIDLISANLQNYIIAPLAQFGLAGFPFDIDGESMARLAADVSDHYAEDNKALQDQIAIRPKIITLKGFVGEVVYNGADSDGSTIQSAVQKLVSLASYLPTLSAAATQITAAAQSESLDNFSLTDTANIYGLVKNLLNASGPEAKQQQAFSYFEALMDSKTIISVQTPWKFLTNMVIIDVVALQSENTKFMSDFAVTMKQIRLAKTISGSYVAASPQDQVNADVNAEDASLQGDAAIQAAAPVPIGDVPGVALPSATLPGAQAQIVDTDSLISNINISNILIPASALNPLP